MLSSVIGELPHEPVVGCDRRRFGSMNANETIVYDQLHRRGFTVLRGGWPDFLALKDGSGLGVEVKIQHATLTRSQQAMKSALAGLGLPVLVVRSWEHPGDDELERLLASAAPGDLYTAWNRVRGAA
jgi:hypothetical protein